LDHVQKLNHSNDPSISLLASKWSKFEGPL